MRSSCSSTTSKRHPPPIQSDGVGEDGDISGGVCALGPTELALDRESFEGDDFGVFGVLGGTRAGIRAGRTAGIKSRLREGICCCTLTKEFCGLRNGVVGIGGGFEGWRVWEKEGVCEWERARDIEGRAEDGVCDMGEEMRVGVEEKRSGERPGELAAVPVERWETEVIRRGLWGGRELISENA